MTKRHATLATCLFLAAGWMALVVGCIVHSRHSPMWVDELYSFDLIQDPSLGHMLAASGDQADGAPPLYYLLVRTWAAVFGLQELSLRLFTSLAFCAALALLWKLLRRAYTFWPSALALALTMGTSHVIRFENCNVRFYGVLFALVALAALLAVRLGESERPGRGLLAANALTQAALVLCHPLGGFYSAALGTAVVCGDRVILRRWRWPTALSYPAGWLALGLWARQLLRQADLNNPHSWVPVPELGDIPGVIYGGSDFYPFFVVFLLLAGWRALGFERQADTASVEDELPAGPARRLLLIAIALIALPIAMWVFSRAVPSNPLFLARYVIGVSIGWAIVLAQLATRFLPPSGAPTGRGATVLLSGTVVFCWSFLITEPGPDYRELTGESDGAFGHADLPIVCLRSHDFLPREHYSPQADRYFYLLDWQVAADPENSRHATVEFKILDALRRNYASLFHHHIVPAEEFLRTHSTFLIHEVPHTSWVALRLKPEEYTITKLEPDRPVDYRRDGVWRMLLVQKKALPAEPLPSPMP